ncbi:MAG: hypothetical protein JWO20_1487 [Candidatus Angelobacter sp.]|jgi:hypothetical protein|nr:hypothetical protein [Candidatus Angelobacter sp.]
MKSIEEMCLSLNHWLNREPTPNLKRRGFSHEAITTLDRMPHPYPQDRVGEIHRIGWASRRGFRPQPKVSFERARL